MHTDTHTHTHTHTYIHTHNYVHGHIHAHNTHIHAHIHTYSHTHMHYVHTYTHTCIHTYTHIHTYIYIYIYIFIYISIRLSCSSSLTQKELCKLSKKRPAILVPKFRLFLWISDGMIHYKYKLIANIPVFLSNFFSHKNFFVRYTFFLNETYNFRTIISTKVRIHFDRKALARVKFLSFHGNWNTASRLSMSYCYY
jgi:hypothetical protein